MLHQTVRADSGAGTQRVSRAVSTPQSALLVQTVPLVAANVMVASIFSHLASWAVGVQPMKLLPLPDDE
jgi:hypothetical protein